jgi:hypothetical protein
MCNIVCATGGQYDTLCGENYSSYIFDYQAYMRNVIISHDALTLRSGFSTPVGICNLSKGIHQ